MGPIYIYIYIYIHTGKKCDDVGIKLNMTRKSNQVPNNRIGN